MTWDSSLTIAELFTHVLKIIAIYNLHNYHKIIKHNIKYIDYMENKMKKSHEIKK